MSIAQKYRCKICGAIWLKFENDTFSLSLNQSAGLCCDNVPNFLDVIEPVNALVQEQAPPQPNEKPAVWDLVVADFKARDQEGRRKYGTPLQPHNGRDALLDAYQEALDLTVYLRQALYERDGK